MSRQDAFDAPNLAPAVTFAELVAVARAADAQRRAANAYYREKKPAADKQALLVAARQAEKALDRLLADVLPRLREGEG